MKIATYNINGINGRIGNLLRWLKEAAPDVVCLQELKTEDHKFPERVLLDAGYHAIWEGQKSWNGVAILRYRKPGAGWTATLLTCTAATSKHLSMAWWSAVYTCRTVTPGRGQNLSINWRGSNG